MSELKQVYIVGDRTFENKEDAQNFIRRPKIAAALKTVTGGNQNLIDWLIEHQDDVESALETGTIRRVTKSDKKALGVAVDQVVADHKGDKKYSFIVENAEAIKEGFRWPAQKRMSTEEKEAAAREALTVASDGNEKLAAFVIENKDAVLEAYQAGVQKRAVSENATNALAEYRAKMAAEKAAREASGQTDAAPSAEVQEAKATAEAEAGTEAVEQVEAAA